MASMNNQALAQRFCDHLKTNGVSLLYDRETGLFWRYKDNHWQVWDRMKDEVVEFTKELVALSKNRIQEIVEMCRYVADPTDRLDDRYLAFDDILLSLDDFSKSAPSPKKIATVRVPAKYSSLTEAEMPQFRAYMDFVCRKEDDSHNEGMEAQLQEMMGYALTPEMTEKCFILYGDGGTGKSVYLSLLSKMVSEPRCSFSSIERLTTREFSMDTLIGKRLNIVHEEQSLNSNVAFLKELVSGNPLDIRRLYSETRTFRPRVKFYFGSNRFPRLDGFDRALGRRIMIVPFTNWVDESDRILHLEDRIAETELPAMFAWALEGLKRLKANNWQFTETEESKEALIDLEEASSSLIEYLRRHWQVDPDGEVAVTEVYEKYTVWCREVGRQPVSKNRLAREGAPVIGRSYTKTADGKSERAYRIRPIGKSEQPFSF